MPLGSSTTAPSQTGKDAGEARSPKSVLLVIDSLACGGAERHVADLAEELTGRGTSVTVACSRGGHFEGRTRRAGATVEVLCAEPVKRCFSLEFAGNIRRLMAREQFDLVHAHLYASSVASAVALLEQPTPLVVTEQTEAPWRSERHRQASALAYGRASQVIGVSRAIADGLRDGFGLPHEKISWIPNGVKFPEVDSSAASGDLGPVVGLIARLVPEKDVGTFLRSAQRLILAYPRARFPIAGDGPLRGELVTLAKELGVENHVEFLGVQQDIEDFLSRLDVLAVSSIAEGTPLAIAEAMGAGVPIVATTAGGIPDQIEAGVHGILVPPRDPQALAAGLKRILDSPAEAQRLAASARTRAVADFGIEAVVDKVESAYAAAIHSAVASA